MGMYLLGGNGQFYKANLHCHTNLSDGYLTPEEVKSLYKSHGYSIVAFTDHDILIPHKDLQDDSFLPLNGMEFTLVSPEEEAGLPGKHPTIHLCMIGLEEDNITMSLYHREKYIKYHPETVRHLLKVDETLPDYERGFEIRDVNEVIAIARAHGFFVTYNHPGWSHDDPRRILSYEGLNGLEVYNSLFVKLGYDDCNQYLYDAMLRAGQRVFPIAADDNHNKYPLGHKLATHSVPGHKLKLKSWTTAMSPKPLRKAVITYLQALPSTICASKANTSSLHATRPSGSSSPTIPNDFSARMQRKMALPLPFSSFVPIAAGFGSLYMTKMATSP